MTTYEVNVKSPSTTGLAWVERCMVIVTRIRRHPLTLGVSIPRIVLSKCYPRLSQSALYMKTERNLSDSLGKSQQTSFKLSSENESSI